MLNIVTLSGAAKDFIHDVFNFHTLVISTLYVKVKFYVKDYVLTEY